MPRISPFSTEKLRGERKFLFRSPFAEKPDSPRERSLSTRLRDTPLPIISLMMRFTSASCADKVCTASPSRSTVILSPTCLTSSSLWEM